MQVAKDVVTDFANDNVIYLELRSTPRANSRTGMMYEYMLTATLQSYYNEIFRQV